MYFLNYLFKFLPYVQVSKIFEKLLEIALTRYLEKGVLKLPRSAMTKKQKKKHGLKKLDVALGSF